MIVCYRLQLLRAMPKMRVEKRIAPRPSPAVTVHDRVPKALFVAALLSFIR